MAERVKVVEVQRSFPSRIGRKATSIYLPLDIHLGLSLWAKEHGTNLQQLGEEAFAMLMEQRGIKPRKPRQ